LQKIFHGKEKTQKAFGTLHIALKLILIISRIHKVKATSFTKCKRLEKLFTFSIISNFM
jgi:hypothetical protein